MGSRTWIKIYCERWLNGTIREETPELRGIWVDLLVLAGSGKYGDSGEIKITDHIGFLDRQLADLLQISRQKWATIKKKLMQTDRVIIKNSNIIVIKNWSKYQSEYERQRPQRQETPKPGNKAEGVTKGAEESAEESAARERDKRIEIENRDREDSSSSSLNKDDAIQSYALAFGDPSEDMEKEIELACSQFSASWVIDAIRETISQGKSSWAYTAGILKNWRKYGKGAKAQEVKQPNPGKYTRGKYGKNVQR